MSKDDDGAAFPGVAFPGVGREGDLRDQEGRTLRDWFAGQALAGGYDPDRVYVIADRALAGRDKNGGE